MIGEVGCFVECLLYSLDIGSGDWDPSGKKGFNHDYTC